MLKGRYINVQLLLFLLLLSVHNLLHTHSIQIQFFVQSFIHSFIQAISIASLQVLYYFHSRHSTDTVPEFHAEAPQATVSEGLAQGPYVAARAGVEPMTLRTKGVDS